MIINQSICLSIKQLRCRPRRWIQRPRLMNERLSDGFVIAGETYGCRMIEYCLQNGIRNVRDAVPASIQHNRQHHIIVTPLMFPSSPLALGECATLAAAADSAAAGVELACAAFECSPDVLANAAPPPLLCSAPASLPRTKCGLPSTVKKNENYPYGSVFRQ